MDGRTRRGESRRSPAPEGLPAQNGEEITAGPPAIRTDGGFRNPLSDLPDTARNLILSAKKIIAEQGFDALTLNRLSVESGENKAMTAYYFGNKAGLIAAVLDSVIHDEYLASEARMMNLEPRELTARVVAEMRGIGSSTQDFRAFYELLPRVLRDEVLRARLLALYRWYWCMKLEWLGLDDDALDDPELQGMARLLSAIIDGLAIQAAIEPEADLSPAYAVLESLIERSLPGFVVDHQAEHLEHE